MTPSAGVVKARDQVACRWSVPLISGDTSKDGYGASVRMGKNRYPDNNRVSETAGVA
jgi:hypothetical protein